MNFADRITESRRWMTAGYDFAQPPHTEEEGGCGVTGFACSIPVGGRHIYEPSMQMHNRGNGKGGGIAAVGLVPEQLGVSREVLEGSYLLQIALLDPACKGAVEADFITPVFDVQRSQMISHVDDFHDVEGLEVCPPDVAQYFVRVKPDVLKAFAEDRGLAGLPERESRTSSSIRILSGSIPNTMRRWATSRRLSFRRTKYADTQDRRLRRADRHVL